MNYTKRFDPKTITEKDLLNELKLLTDKLGKTPSRNDMKNGTSITKRLYLYDKQFGGLTEACKKIGIIANKGGNDLKHTDEELLNNISELKQKLNKTPTQEDVNKDGKYSINAYKKHFGTYNKALEKLNIKHNMKHNISEQEIINDIVRISKLLNKSPMVTEFDKHTNTVSHMTVYSKLNCGLSWNSVLKKCGLKVINNKNLTEQELKDEIERLKNIMGRIPGYYDMLQLGYYSPETYADKYGTYVDALKYFGYNYTPQSQWQNQTYTIGNDNQQYKSKFEANIANSLLELKIKEKIINYTYEKQICSDRKWTCDFFVELKDKNIWLEADGMGKNRSSPYDEDNEKINYYEQNNLKYIIIPYKQINFSSYLSNILSI